MIAIVKGDETRRAFYDGANVRGRIFDRTPGKPWDEKIWHEEREYNGRKIMVWGM